MMTILVIAEKKSVAKAIAGALGAKNDRGGWMEGGNLIVTWAQGHLVDLAMPEEYKDRQWGKWSMDNLPIDPTGSWEWKVSGSRGAGERYRVVESLLRRDDVDRLVNACDPDREGEAIWRRIVTYAGANKAARRLWVASLEADAIREAWRAMKPESAYNGLAWAAEIRAKADWLTGINASRTYSLLYGGKFGVGRVQTPTLAMIVDRDRLITSHKPTPFWTVEADMGGWRLTSRRLDNENEADALRERAAAGTFRILSVKRSTAHDRPPCLYDLTGLQRDMSTMYALTAERTLQALQHLYELGLATYPRTDSKYITHDDLPALNALLGGSALSDGFVGRDALPRNPRPELTVNDAKVAGHTAILPTSKTDAKSLEALDGNERLVLTRIVRRMWEAVADDHVHLVTEVKALLGQEEFTSRSDETVTPGWKAIEPAHADADDEDGGKETTHARNVIPANLTDGVTASPVNGAKVTRGETRPPKPFTEASLLAAMEHASRYVQDKDLKAALDDDESHSGGIGTPATRADIIEKLVSTGLVERKRRQLRATKQGMTLIDVVEPRLRDVELTARMEQALSDVEHGTRDPYEVMELFRQEARRIPADAQANRHDSVSMSDDDWGACPRCGRPVKKTGSVWQCSSNKSSRQEDGSWRTTDGCGWRLFPKLCGRTITDAAVRKLLAGGTVTMKGLTSKSGKKFDAKVVIDKDKGTAFDFAR